MDQDVLIEVNKIWSKITQLKSLINYAKRTIGSEKELYLSRASSIVYQVEYDFEQYLARLKKQFDVTTPNKLKIKAKRAETTKRNIFAENPFDMSSKADSTGLDNDSNKNLFNLEDSNKDILISREHTAENDEYVKDEAQKDLRNLLLNQALKAESLLNVIQTEKVEEELQIDKEQHNCLIHRGSIMINFYINFFSIFFSSTEFSFLI